MICPRCRQHTMLAQTPSGQRIVISTMTGSTTCIPWRPPLAGFKRKGGGPRR